MGGLEFNIVFSKLLLFSKSAAKLNSLFVFSKKVLDNIIAFSAEMLFSFSIDSVFSFLAKQLSTSSDMPWSSIKLVNLIISSIEIFFINHKHFNFI